MSQKSDSPMSIIIIKWLIENELEPIEHENKKLIPECMNR